MTNIPQDIIDDATAAGFNSGLDAYGNEALYVVREEINLQKLTKFAHLREERMRSSGEPFGWLLIEGVKVHFYFNKHPEATFSESFIDKHKDNLKAIFTAPQQSPIPQGWLQAVDEALVVAHVGIVHVDDSYEDARAKLNSLIDLHIAIATDPSVNGGFSLQPAAPSAPIEAQLSVTLRKIAKQLRDAGANLPAPQIKGTIESSIVTGLSIALALVENEIPSTQAPKEAAK